MFASLYIPYTQVRCSFQYLLLKPRVFKWCFSHPGKPISSSGVASYGALGHVPPPSNSKSESQLSKYSVVCEISWCRCQQLTALSISTASVTKLLVIEQLLQPALKFTVSAPWNYFNLFPSSQQILATPLIPSCRVKLAMRNSRLEDDGKNKTW